ncbi:helix-turn-helix domain-containing protein [Pannonibacter phragmitetus]|uniref:helix-turn-helix domain-containing protein n=1 Tax=Pannonibacter phragmitetus TaxID=121719 RepID=UPI003D2F274D
MEKGDGCSNLVISQSVQLLSPALSHLLEQALPPSAPFRRLRLPVPGGTALEQLLDGRTTPAAMLRKEGQCLALIGHAIEELSACPRPDCVTDDTALLVQRLTALLAERLAETISMADIEREAGLSHVTLNQIFRKATGATVFERLRTLRLEAAERMVRLTDRSLTEIAGDCGFSDASHLSNAFRKRFGSTASAWRKNMRQKL